MYTLRTWEWNSAELISKGSGKRLKLCNIRGDLMEMGEEEEAAAWLFGVVVRLLGCFKTTLQQELLTRKTV
jgi:hypothetical protein